MTQAPAPDSSRQSIAVDDFLYFFLRLRKQRIRIVVQALRAAHPLETREQLAERLISSCVHLSFLGGSLFHVPALFPGFSGLLGALGFVAGTSLLTRMHLYLILEIALVYGRDIDDRARVSEMMTVVAATGAAMGVPHVLSRVLKLHPLLAIGTSGVLAATVARMVGDTAVGHYAEISRESLATLRA